MKQRRPRPPQPGSLQRVAASRAPSLGSMDPPAPLAARGPPDSGVGGRARRYPHLTVYLPRKAVRLIKQIALDQERRISDVIADAIDDYLVKNRYGSLKQLAD